VHPHVEAFLVVRFGVSQALKLGHPELGGLPASASSDRQGKRIQISATAPESETPFGEVSETEKTGGPAYGGSPVA
jgi:hypothetical protein